MNNIIIYTDGSGTTGGDAGWAFVLLNEESPEDVEISSGWLDDATNNVAEMMAVTRGLEYCKKYYPEDAIIVRSDSAYVINAFNDGWLTNWQKNGWKNKRRKPVANKEYWTYLLFVAEDLDISWEHVKGHSGDVYNELADELCGKARKERKGV